MAANQDFDIALAFGEGREDRLKEVLEGRTVEVKSQTTTKTHVFIEYESRGKPSGIATTKADFWAIEVHPDTFIVLPTDDLIVLARTALKQFGSRRGGDDMTSEGAIVPNEWLVNRKVDR